MLTAYNSQINGLTESLNNAFANLLPMYADIMQYLFVIHPFVTLTYSTTKQETTGFTQFLLVQSHGMEKHGTQSCLSIPTL